MEVKFAENFDYSEVFRKEIEPELERIFDKMIDLGIPCVCQVYVGDSGDTVDAITSVMPTSHGKLYQPAMHLAHLIRHYNELCHAAHDVITASKALNNSLAMKIADVEVGDDSVH